MKRVLLVSCEGLGNGGVQNVIMNIVRNLSDRYCFDILLFTSERRYYDGEFEKYGRIFRIPRYEGTNFLRKKIDYYIRGKQLYKSVVNLLCEFGPYDVIHCNDEFESAILLKAAYDCGIPIRIVHTHIISMRGNIVFNLINIYRKYCIEKYSTVRIGCSNDAIRSFYLKNSVTKLILNTYDEKRFDKNKYIYKFSKDINILQVGNFCENKNQLFSIKVLEYLKKNYEKVHLNLVGNMNGSYYDLLKKYIEENNIQNYVVFHNHNADIPKLLSESNVFLCPSICEGFGISLIEAQAMGVRCYASTGIPEIVNAGGVTFIPLNKGSDYWAEKILENMKSNDFRTNYSFDLTSFSNRKIMQDYVDVYEGR